MFYSDALSVSACWTNLADPVILTLGWEEGLIHWILLWVDNNQIPQPPKIHIFAIQTLLMREHKRKTRKTKWETIDHSISLYTFTLYFYLASAQTRCGESVPDGLLVKGKLKWKEPFKKETVTVTCQFAVALPSGRRRTGIPLDGQHAI